MQAQVELSTGESSQLSLLPALQLIAPLHHYATTASDLTEQALLLVHTEQLCQLLEAGLFEIERCTCSTSVGEPAAICEAQTACLGKWTTVRSHQYDTWQGQ